MSKSVATKEKTREKLQQENEILEALLEEHIAAYGILRDACIGVVESKDLVLKNGSQASILLVCELVEQALTQAEIIVAIGEPPNDPAWQKIFCDSCQRWLDTDDEQQGHCLVCFHS